MSQSDTVYDALNQAILSGHYRPGAKLSEPVIAEEMGLSRAPVREAIRRLQERGMVSHAPNQGVRVASPTLDDYLSLLEVREGLEGMATAMAAHAMTDRQLEELAELVEEHGRMLRDDPQGPYLQASRDEDFHVQIACASGNPVLIHLLCEDFYPRLKLCRLQHQGVPGRGLAAWQEHRRILAALQDRDAEVAELMMRRHIRAARAALLAARSGRA
ncbi:GntR family transcriptional regulator [Paracoccus caeni]|uniref:GntR family transcriptional regulator n=1 Tax=Paracoccus caeni TaxID=657651 RepID=A0A934SN04_9RHOB|nr:GntR family transcriptional regulator [Paracoccus caeni]MBK4217318.1 GntR family transcriptional regulator [Paracoccus caeni]